jgi:hypothetical protein
VAYPGPQRAYESHPSRRGSHADRVRHTHVAVRGLRAVGHQHRRGPRPEGAEARIRPSGRGGNGDVDPTRVDSRHHVDGPGHPRPYG